MEFPFYQSLENMVVSVGLQGHLLLLACVRPPGSCNFLEEFMSFVGFLSTINSSYDICGASTFMLMYQVVMVINL